MLARQNCRTVLIYKELVRKKKSLSGIKFFFWTTPLVVGFFFVVATKIFPFCLLDPEIKFSKENCLPVEMSKIQLDYFNGGWRRALGRQPISMDRGEKFYGI